MNSTKLIFYSLFLLHPFYFKILIAKSIPSPLTEASSFNEEKQYPNGTVLGQYYYSDNEGNPIIVKYFANDSSYGVEMKSVRVLGNGEQQSQEETNKISTSSISPGEFLSPADFNYFGGPTSKNNVNKEDPWTSKMAKPIRKIVTEDPEFETFNQFVMSSPRFGGSEKIRVYFGNKRRARDSKFEEILKYLNKIKQK